MNERQPDILCVSETWLTADVLGQHITIPDFNVYRRDTCRGGGVCIYVRNTCSVSVIEVTIDRVDGIEDLWLTVQCRKLPSVIIGCMYRHPHAASLSFDYILYVLITFNSEISLFMYWEILIVIFYPGTTKWNK